MNHTGLYIRAWGVLPGYLAKAREAICYYQIHLLYPAVLEAFKVFFLHSTALSWIHFQEQDFSGIIFFHSIDDV